VPASQTHYQLLFVRLIRMIALSVTSFSPSLHYHHHCGSSFIVRQLQNVGRRCITQSHINNTNN